MRITKQDHERVAHAVAQAERGTSGEIVTIMAGRSASYLDVVHGWMVIAVLVALGTLASLPTATIDAVLARLLGWQAQIDHHEMLLALLILATVVAAAVRLVLAPLPMRLAMTPGWMEQRRVRARALDCFRIGAEKRTAGHSAVLIYVSLAERRVEIIADRAIHGLVEPDAWGDAAKALVAAMRDGRPGDGMADAVHHVGALLAVHFPPQADDRNELPDRLIELGTMD